MPEPNDGYIAEPLDTEDHWKITHYKSTGEIVEYYMVYRVADKDFQGDPIWNLIPPSDESHIMEIVPQLPNIGIAINKAKYPDNASN